MRPNEKIINKAYTRLSFGAGAYGIEIYTMGKNIVIKDGEPQQMATRYAIKDASPEIISLFAGLDEGELLDRKAKGLQAFAPFTHFYRRGKWISIGGGL